MFRLTPRLADRRSPTHGNMTSSCSRARLGSRRLVTLRNELVMLWSDVSVRDVTENNDMTLPPVAFPGISRCDPIVASQLYTRLSLSYLSPPRSSRLWLRRWAGGRERSRAQAPRSAVSCLIQSLGRCGEFKGRKEELEPGFGTTHKVSERFLVAWSPPSLSRVVMPVSWVCAGAKVVRNANKNFKDNRTVDSRQ